MQIHMKTIGVLITDCHEHYTKFCYQHVKCCNIVKLFMRGINLIKIFSKINYQKNNIII